MGEHYDRHESKYFHTAILMDEALLELVTRKEYEYITISEVVKKAGVNRSTFYLHYTGMDDLLKEAIGYSLKQFYERFGDFAAPDVCSADKEQFVFVSPKFLIPYLDYIKENRKLFLAAKSKPQVFGIQDMKDSFMTKLFYPILTLFHVPEQEQKYMLSYYVSGIQGMVMTWVNQDCQDDVPFMADCITRYVMKTNQDGK